MKRAAVVFIHGLFSSGRTWSRFRELISDDGDLTEVDLLNFDYASPWLNWSPLRRIPNYGVLAENLQTYLEVEAASYEHLILVSHSQGGLIEPFRAKS